MFIYRSLFLCFYAVFFFFFLTEPLLKQASVMGWRLLSRRAVAEWKRLSPAVAVEAALPPLTIARREARPPRPPVWAVGAMQRCSPAPRTRADSSASTPVKKDAAPSHAHMSTHISHTNVSTGHEGHAHTINDDDQRSSGSSGPFPFSSTALPQQPRTQVFASGMRSRISTFDVDAPPPNSYAYVHSKSDDNTMPAKPPRQRGSPADGSTCAAAALSPKKATLVSVEGETVPIAAAPGAVRRALRHRSLSNTGGSSSSSTAVANMNVPASSSSAPHPLEHILQPTAEEAMRHGVGYEVGKESREGAAAGASVSLTPAERQARRLQQRQTREARERRRLERAEQSSGGALHPCRLQGGCCHPRNRDAVGSVGACPYRHFPADVCVTQLREGHCALYDIGCCPWRHGDVGEGVVDRGLHSATSSADTSAAGDDFASIYPLSPLEVHDDGSASIQRSAEKVGRLLRLCVDAVAAVMEEAAEERRVHFMGAAADASCRWHALRSAMEDAQAARDGGLLYIEALRGEAAGNDTTTTTTTDATAVWLTLSVPADLAWCAMTSETAAEQPAEGLLCHNQEEGTSCSDAEWVSREFAAPEAAHMSTTECAYWSSFFTYLTNTASSSSALVERGAQSPAAASREKEQEEMGLSHGVTAGVDAANTALPRLRLTPCMSAWVLEAAAAQVREEAQGRPNGIAAQAPRRSRTGAVAAPTSPHVCFQQATLFLLGWRRTELQRCVRGTRRLDAGGRAGVALPAETQAAAPQAASRKTARPRHVQPVASMRWTPVLFLRDALMASYVSIAGQNSTTADDVIDAESQLFTFRDDDGGDGMAGESAEPALPAASNRHNSLLSLFFNFSTDGDEERAREAAAWVHRGRLFTPQASSITSTDRATPAAVGGTTATVAAADVQAGASSTTSDTPDTPLALATAFQDAWAELHDVILQLQWGLLRSFSQVLPAPVTTTTTTAMTVALSLFLQPALLQLVATVSAAFAARHESTLRRLAGWQPWTDQQLFIKTHAAVYNAATYARHYLPVARLSMHNSLVNTLLLLSTHYANVCFRLDEPSEVHQLLLAFPGGADDAAARQWWAATQQAEHHARQQHLQPCISLSLGFLTALQELSRQQLATQQSLMQTYEQRRTTYASADTEERIGSDYARQSQSHRGGQPSVLGGGSRSRTRKYHRPSLAAQQAEQRSRLEELHGVPLLDRLLPFGSAAVSPDAGAALLRHLLEGGHPYKALKLAASMVRASRMLRHANKQPQPTLQQGSRTVHTRVWSKRLLRYVLVKKRVPVLRLVGDVERGEEEQSGAEGRPGAQSRRGVRSVGLVFVLSARVVEEVARVGLRMGKAGTLLADGVQQDCLRGALVDFTRGRALPVPSMADVEGALRRFKGGGPGEEVSDAPNTSSFGRSATSHASELAQAQRQQQQSFRKLTEHHTSISGDLMRLVGAGGEPLTISPSSLSTARRRTSLREEEGAGAPHRRVAPTPLLLELLQTHTPPTDTTRHTSYLRFFLQDVPRFSTWPVLFALQYQACEPHSRYATARMDSVSSAARAMQTVYVMTITALCRGAGTAAADPSLVLLTGNTRPHMNVDAMQRQLAQEAEKMLPQVQEWILSDPSSLGPRGRREADDDAAHASLSSGPVRVKDVKAMLLHDTGYHSGVDDDDLGAHGGGREGEEGEDSADGLLRRRRRARLQLPVLLHHVWTSAVEHRSPLQQCTALWAVCTATLLGTTSRALSHVLSTSKSGSDTADFAASALHHSYVAAGVLMPSLAPPPQSSRYIDATVRALLLSPALVPEEKGNVTGAATTTAEWPMLLSSAHTPTVSTMREFLLLQLSLLSSLLEESPYSPRSDVDASAGPPLQTFLNAFTAVHGPLPAEVRAWPSWSLFKPLLHHPAVAHGWLDDTLLSPSADLLVWSVSAVTRTDAEGYAMLHSWLLHLPGGPHLSEELRQTLLAETARRHRSARSRQRSRK